MKLQYPSGRIPRIVAFATLFLMGGMVSFSRAESASSITQPSVKLSARTEAPLVDRTWQAVAVGQNDGTSGLPIDATDFPQLAAIETDGAKAGGPTASGVANSSAELSRESQGSAIRVGAAAFVHPGLLHSEEDFQRMRRNIEREPWKSGWEKLSRNRHASLKYKPRPVEIVYRGRDRKNTNPENYALLFNDTAAAYQCALRWRISGDDRYAEKAIEILNAWSSTLKLISGSTDNCLARGIYGYQFANAAEIMRAYSGWKPEDFERFKNMMLTVFAPQNQRFLELHNGTIDEHYWANWDLCNMASLMAIGVLCDRRDLYDFVVNYFKEGRGMGSIKHAVNFIHPDGLGQWQEMGRDQGHTNMGIVLTAVICEQAWKQGDDLYGYDDNRFLAGCEYVAKYNLGEEVPFEKYVNKKHGTMTKPSDVARGVLRPGWEIVYNHYVKRKGLPAPYTTKMAEKVRPEGGGGDFGPNSGGYDQLGFGTLTATLDEK